MRKRLLLKNMSKVIISILKMRLLQRFKQIGKVKKQEKINEMMEDLFSDEMKKLLDELSQLAKEMNKEKVLEKLEDVDESNLYIDNFKIVVI